MSKQRQEERTDLREEEFPVTAQEGTEDYYFNDDGLMVMTAAYHLKRGFCCGNACRHCPYDHINVTE